MNARFYTLVCAAVLAFGLLLAGCASSAPSDQSTEAAEGASTQAPSEEGAQSSASAPEDGVYLIEVETDSSMFHAESCTLTVKDGTYTATLTLPGEGFSRLYFGTDKEAESAPDADIYDYYLNDEGKYSFDVPVAALDKELDIAAWGQRRDRWYPHTITFPTPTSSDRVADADKAA